MASGTARSKLAAAKGDIGGALAVIAASQRKARYLAMLSAVCAFHAAEMLPDKVRSAPITSFFSGLVISSRKAGRIPFTAHNGTPARSMPHELMVWLMNGETKMRSGKIP